MIDLGTLGGSYGSAVAVNNHGLVVGYSGTASGETHMFSWTRRGGMADRGTLGGTFGYAAAVSNTRSWLAQKSLQLVRSIWRSCSSFIRFSISPRWQYTSS